MRKDRVKVLRHQASFESLPRLCRAFPSSGWRLFATEWWWLTRAPSISEKPSWKERLSPVPAVGSQRECPEVRRHTPAILSSHIPVPSISKSLGSLLARRPPLASSWMKLKSRCVLCVRITASPAKPTKHLLWDGSNKAG